MSKYLEDIIERQLENGARDIYPYQFPQPHHMTASRAQGSSARPSESPLVRLMSPETVRQLKELIARESKVWTKRLESEMVLAYRANKERTVATNVGFITKAEAVKTTGAPFGWLLDLDSIWGGSLVFGDHLYISEAKLAQSVQRYGADEFFNGILNEGRAAA